MASAAAVAETAAANVVSLDESAPASDFQEQMFETSRLHVMHPVEPVTLVWKDLEVSVNVPVTHPVTGQPLRGKPCKKAPTVTKTILNKISGSAGPGELIAVLGASGAGKTTFVDVLAGRVSYSGTYTMNGAAATSDALREKSAYVQQEDMFFPYLTVREHLWYQAQLRLPRSLSAEAKEERLRELIDKLGLSKVESTQIGFMSGQSGRRGISGGERKRLAFASEVLMDPSVMFADEPTSGLDAFMAESVVRQLQALAQAGRCIIATVHQPSTNVYGLFSKIMLLSEGKVVYFGPTSNVIQYFTNLGYPCPIYSNPADFFIKMLAVIKDDGSSGDRVAKLRAAWDVYLRKYSSPVKNNDPAELLTAADSQTWAAWRWFAQYHPDAVAGGGKVLADAVASVTSATTDAMLAAATPLPDKMLTIEYTADLRVKDCASEWPPLPPHSMDKTSFFKRTSGYANDWLHEAGILYKRATTNISRDPMLTKARIFSTIIPAVLMGLIFLQLRQNQRGVQGKIGGLFFCIINQSMISLFGVLQTFPVERAMFMRETQNGYYRVSTYYVSKTFSDLPFQVVFPIVFATIVYWMIDLRDSAGPFFAIMGFIVLCAQVALSMGFFVAAISPSINVSMALGPALMFPLVMFCGFLVNTSSIPVWLRWLESISFFKYAFHNCMYFLWHDVSLECVPPDCRFTDGNDVLKFYAVDDRIGKYTGVLFALMVGWRILTYLILLRKSQRSAGKKN